jgi:predicted amidohydrolase YtcJ
MPDETIDRETALRIWTINNALATGEQDLKGTIEPGKLADLAVLAQDPLAIAPERIKDIPVDITIVDGRVAFVHDGAHGSWQ